MNLLPKLYQIKNNKNMNVIISISYFYSRQQHI